MPGSNQAGKMLRYPSNTSNVRNNSCSVKTNSCNQKMVVPTKLQKKSNSLKREGSKHDLKKTKGQE